MSATTSLQSRRKTKISHPKSLLFRSRRQYGSFNRIVVIVFIICMMMMDSTIYNGNSYNWCVHALPPFRAIDILNQNYKNRSRRKSSVENDDVQELYMTQQLDHFNVRNSMYTFQQRYFYSDRYVSSKTIAKPTANNHTTIEQQEQQHRQIAFLCIGGEGPYLDKSVLHDSPHCTGDMLYTAEHILQAATSHIDIHLFAIEHRYYGESYPQSFPPSSDDSLSPVTNDHLVYLSSRQSLADVAHFVSRHAEYEWIVFGASYPGVLAAWARYHYPHLIAGAVSNSAPVQSLLDMAVYNNHVASVLSTPTGVGGSPLCYQIYRTGHDQLATAIQQEQQNKGSSPSQIAMEFNLCNVSAFSNRQNVDLFIGDGILYPGTQENDPSCTEELCNIAKKCNALVEHYNNNTNNSSHREMDALIHVTKSYTALTMANDDDMNNNNNSIDTKNKSKKYCLDVDWEETIAYISDPILGMEDGLRSWLWQTCTEFGFYQTCERNSTCPFAQGYHLLGQDLEICQRAFNISSATVANCIQDTNVWSGGWKLAHSGATQIVSITGTVDPWSELALEKDAHNTDMPVYHVPGASHHFWTHPVRILTDGPDIQAARTFIYHTVRGFLNLTDGHHSTNDSAATNETPLYSTQ